MELATWLFVGEPTESIFSVAVRLITGMAWPCVILFFLITHRTFISRMLKALAALAESADKVKIWQFELQRNIDEEVKRVAVTSQEDDAEYSLDQPPSAETAVDSLGAVARVKSNIPLADVLAAARVGTLVQSAGDFTAEEEVLGSVRTRMRSLANEYEITRASMPSSNERTKALNGVARQMRALGVAAKPLLSEFTGDYQSAGDRLCAIAILQMLPDPEYIGWLGDRFYEEQPFLLYQSAIALMESVRKFGKTRRANLFRVISSASNRVAAFKGGTPDSNTLKVLGAALDKLENPNDPDTSLR